MVELNDPYGGGYFATRDRWQARKAADIGMAGAEADAQYKLALIAKQQQDALEAARLAPYEAQKREWELAKLQGEVGRGQLDTAQKQNEYVRQRIGPIVAAHARGELPEMAARTAIEREVLRAREQFGIGDDEVRTLLQAGPQDWGRYIEQSLSVEQQRAAPPAPVSIYQGDRVEQRRWNPRTYQEEVVGGGGRWNPNAGVNVVLNTEDKLRFAGDIGDDYRKAMAPLNDLATNINLIRTYAARPDALNSQQLQSVLANLAATKVRAQAELNKYGNFGDLLTRFFGAVSKLGTGTYTKEQRSQILKLADDLERNVLAPARARVTDLAKRRAKFGEIPEDLIIEEDTRTRPVSDEAANAQIPPEDEALINKYRRR